MSAIVAPDEEESYLLALLDSADGLDLAEFAWQDPESDDGCYRAWDFQWSWYLCDDVFQIDMGARATGKTVSMKMRAFAFPFNKAGQKMLITAPELNHLRPIVDAVESALLTTRIGREMLPDTKGQGINRQPHWQVRFKNGAQIISRLPNKDGKGVKGQHVIQIEMDECFPAGTLVLTRAGHKPIEDVEVGDEVFTHRNRWRPVTATMTRERETCTVIGAGHPGLVSSTNHKFWARKTELVPHKYPGGSWAKRKSLGSPAFVPAFDLAPTEGYPSDNKVRDGAYHWATPTEFPAEPLPGLPNGVLVNDDFWWLVGLYLAEGNCSTHNLCWSVATHEVPDVTGALDAIKVSWRINDSLGDCQRIYLRNVALRDWLVQHCGRRGGNDMRVPTWVLGQSEAVRARVLAGYVYGDGNLTTDGRYAPGRWQATCVNRELILSVKLLAQTLGFSVTLYFNDLRHLPASVIAEGTDQERVIQRSQQYQLKAATRSQTEQLDGQRFSQVKQVVPSGRTETLYDLTVEEDHSFVVETIIVSNSQDYPLAGWVEIVDTLNRGLPGAMFRCHGVSKGIRDRFFELTQEGSGWTVHRPQAMHRPSWGKTERDEKTIAFGGSRQSVDYKRNIYGEHGDASNAVFVLAKLMACVDTDQGSEYNTDIYAEIKIAFERLQGGDILAYLDLPQAHLQPYSQSVDRKEVGSPKGFSAYWGGMDVGVTNHPSEILICGQRQGSDFLELLLRVNLQRVNTDDQKVVVERIFEFYGSKLKAFALDKTGVGFPIWDQLSRHPVFGSRIYGYNFSEKVVVAFEDRPLEKGEKQEDLAIWRNVVEETTDLLRNDYVDAKKMRLPYDRELLLEFQGQVYQVVKDTGTPYGKRRLFSGGSFHCLDAMKMLMAGRHLPALAEQLARTEAQKPVLDVFMSYGSPESGGMMSF